MTVTINDMQLLMEIGGFKTHEEYRAWFDTPLEDWDEPDWLEIAQREVGWYDTDSESDNDPEILADMNAEADEYLQEKVDRLLEERGYLPNGEKAKPHLATDVMRKRRRRSAGRTPKRRKSRKSI